MFEERGKSRAAAFSPHSLITIRCFCLKTMSFFLGFFISLRKLCFFLKSLPGRVGSRRSDGSCVDCRSLSERSVSDTFGTGTVSLRCAGVCVL